MTDDKQLCGEHTGCMARIDNLEKTSCRQWKVLGEQDHRIDKIIMRLNVILGGIAVAIFMLLINLGFKLNGSS
jgi:hypothetical protein